ncbi:hypothetical protein HBI56_045430 [Parastagonospora nodorum]|nr:hypothetical protein HBH51_151260 [Parastagonospora nodorum]KAH3977394.1 hypothetical protein HBH52_111580 [Parastagonospora nodorum]KAH4103126.1 hypothetical protein HBH46_114380 [Parastagonospora nodorum]KAH4121263.1 hypothetical protein HBH47_099450 [Parastagonospora nodorum]KAH4199541.1 hypothetical protein HBI95_174740 [Parastagonospora nodorum]
MVGVAGRSKGCITCRKRKKGCDLKQPECGQCIERGLPCGGYDKDRVFIYHDAGVKRTTLASQYAQSPRGASSGMLSPPETPPTTSLISTTPAQAYSGSDVFSMFPRVLSASFAQSAYKEKSLEAFISTYVPRGDLSSTNEEGKQLVGMMPRLNSQDEALRLAILAMGTLALSKQTNDSYLGQQGRNIYGKALAETRRALQDPSRARSTAMLAIPYVMALFEILFGAEEASSKQAQNWLSHAQGEIALIVARGPEAFTEDAAHAIFVNARWRPLIASCRTRTKSILNEKRWKTIPWRGRTKTPQDSLLDIMAGVPEILANIDRWGALSAGTPQDEATDLATCAKCWTLHIELQTWLVANEHEIHTPVTTTPTPITFPNFDVACLTIRYWVIALMLYSSLDTASRIPTTDISTMHPDRPHPRQFARLIARSANYFFQERYGIVGPTTYSFPLGNTMLYLNRNLMLDGQYAKLVGEAWNSPNMPMAIKNFLNSQRLSVS